MILPWKTNNERPQEEAPKLVTDPAYDGIYWYNIIVYSKKRNFFGELHYQPEYENLDGEIIEESVSNDEGFFEFPWKDVDYWMSLREFKKFALKDLNKNND